MTGKTLPRLAAVAGLVLYLAAPGPLFAGGGLALCLLALGFAAPGTLRLFLAPRFILPGFAILTATLWLGGRPAWTGAALPGELEAAGAEGLRLLGRAFCVLAALRVWLIGLKPEAVERNLARLGLGEFGRTVAAGLNLVPLLVEALREAWWAHRLRGGRGPRAWRALLGSIVYRTGLLAEEAALARTLEERIEAAAAAPRREESQPAAASLRTPSDNLALEAKPCSTVEPPSPDYYPSSS